MPDSVQRQSRQPRLLGGELSALDGTHLSLSNVSQRPARRRRRHEEERLRRRHHHHHHNHHHHHHDYDHIEHDQLQMTIRTGGCHQAAQQPNCSTRPHNSGRHRWAPSEAAQSRSLLGEYYGQSAAAHDKRQDNNNINNNSKLPAQRLLSADGASVLLGRALFGVALIALVHLAPVAESVDCFKCSSRNGSNPACEDPFHNTNSTRVLTPMVPEPLPSVIYHTPCYSGRKGREGLFPASACIKLTGVFDATGETLFVRHCALDSGTLTQDTELARMSHCGKFQFEGDMLKGCVLACPEDACNAALPRIGASSLTARQRLVTWTSLLLSLSVVLRHAGATPIILRPGQWTQLIMHGRSSTLPRWLS